MLKKIVLASVLGGAAASISAVNLDLFQNDFDTLMTSMAQDIAPTLRLGALAGDLQADASINHFDLTLVPSLGFNLADGVGTALRPGATTWTFLDMSTFIPSGFGTTFENLMAYPSYKFAVGVAVGAGWDVTLSGNYLPSVVSKTLLKSAVGDKPAPELGYVNIGVDVNKTILKDTGSLASAPGLSLGVGYHYASFKFDVDVDGWIPNVDITNTQTQTTTGSLEYEGGTQVFTADVHVSKRLGFFIPYAKLTGAYENTTVTGKADLTADVFDTSDNSHTTKTFSLNPSVNLSDFAFLTTLGFDLDFFVVRYNLNVITDMGRAGLSIHSFDLDGIDANAFVINTGIHWAY